MFTTNHMGLWCAARLVVIRSTGGSLIYGVGTILGVSMATFNIAELVDNPNHSLLDMCKKSGFVITDYYGMSSPALL